MLTCLAIGDPHFMKRKLSTNTSSTSGVPQGCQGKEARLCGVLRRHTGPFYNCIHSTMETIYQNVC